MGNVAPALMGGMTLIDPDGNVCALPVPSSWRLVVLHPQVVIKTAESRAVLPDTVLLADAVKQAAWLGRFVHELHAGRDWRRCMRLPTSWWGRIVGQLMPHWEACQTAAVKA